MPDVVKVLGRHIADGYFVNADAELLHECYGIVIGAVRSAETGHRNANHLRAVIAQSVCCQDAD